MSIVYFDVAAIAITLTLLFATFAKKLYRSNSSKAYIVMLVILVITTVFDAFSCYPKFFSALALDIFTTLYHFFRNLLLLSYLCYVISLCELEPVIKKKKYWIFIIGIPIMIILGIIASNPFTHLIFEYTYVDYDGNIVDYLVYHRKTLIALIYANSVIYFVVSLIIIIRYRKLFTKREIASICAIFPLTLISLIIQFFNNGYLVEMMFSSFSAILISIAIERPEEYFSDKFLIASKKSFIKAVKKFFLFKQDMNMVIIKIKNYYELYNQYSYEAAVNYTRMMINDLEKRYKILDKTIEPYYLDDGIFLVFTKSESVAIQLANQLFADINVLKNSKSKFAPDSQLVVADLLNDFKDYQDIVFFINNLRNRIIFNKDVIIFKEIKNEKNYQIVANIDKIIDDGLKNDEFLVYYQPIYDVKNNKYSSAEALVRLISKEYGFISPGAFIPYAEKSGRVIDIDKFVFETVCKFVSSDEFKDLGLDYIEVNLSTVDCINPKLYENIINVMEKYRVKPSQINIEITESYDSLNEEAAAENIMKLKEYGINFSLDDFGTGYSNIERFSILPISLVKIDKSLVDSSDDKQMQAVLKNTFGLIKSLSRKTIIEGVETEEQANRFIGFDCDNIQGYYYSKPLPQDEFINFIKEKNNGESD